MPVRPLDPEQEFVLDAAFGRVEAAKRAVDQARRELGTVMRAVGLSASARHLKRSRQWALQVAQVAEEPKGPAEDPGANDDLADSIRRLGIVEPILVEAIGDDLLRVLDGHRRLRIAREAGLTSLPVSLMLTTRSAGSRSAGPVGGGPRWPESQSGQTTTSNVAAAERAAKSHSRIKFSYHGLQGEPGLRTLDVWGVVWRSGFAYMVGYDQHRSAIRTFRLDRVMDAITTVGEGSPPPEGFSAERNVWSQLDPEIVEAMKTMTTFLEYFQEVQGEALPD